MAGKMERVMAKERKMLSSYSGGSSVPERMPGKMERVMAKERKILSRLVAVALYLRGWQGRWRG
jgi:muconolactone delta-isomerase